jgi:hypothetical protein
MKSASIAAKALPFAAHAVGVIMWGWYDGRSMVPR